MDPKMEDNYRPGPKVCLSTSPASSCHVPSREALPFRSGDKEDNQPLPSLLISDGSPPPEFWSPWRSSASPAVPSPSPQLHMPLKRPRNHSLVDYHRRRSRALNVYKQQRLQHRQMNLQQQWLLEDFQESDVPRPLLPALEPTAWQR